MSAHYLRVMDLLFFFYCELYFFTRKLFLASFRQILEFNDKFSYYSCNGGLVHTLNLKGEVHAQAINSN